MIRIIIISALILFLTQTAFGQKKIYDVDADKHIGEIGEVSGIINSFKILKKSKTILLFCGTNYPVKYFTVIVSDKGERPDGYPKITGWGIVVTGLIIKYKGMPAIKVDNWVDIQRVLWVDHVPADL